MPTFGFSAFLKLISLNTRPQRTLIRQRISKGQSQGYDFHRSLRLRANRYLVDGVSIPELLLTLEEIKRAPERTSAKRGLEQLEAWRSQNPGDILSFEPALFESPAKNFKVQFSPNFGIKLDGQAVALHIWNTARPELDSRMVRAALSLFPSLYADHDKSPDDLGVLSLPKLQLFRLGGIEERREVGIRLVRRLDDIMEEIGRETERETSFPAEQPIEFPFTR